MNVTKKSLKQLREMLDTKQISAVELTQEYLKNVKANESLNAFITLTEEEAVRNAKAAQAVIDSGEAKALTGIPAAVKDNICTADIKTTCGSKMLESFTPFYDAEVIAQLKSQNYVLIGKTNMDEFAMGNSNRTSVFGAVKNPRDNERVPGGSSGGSAAAVAADMCAFALGTDTRGSIRHPASFCGIAGLKPTYDLLSRHGIAAFSGSLDVVGPFAKSAEDCGVIMNSLTDKGEDYTALINQDVSGLKIAIPAELFNDDISDEMKTAVMDTAKRLEAAGAVLINVSIPEINYSTSASLIIGAAECVTAMARFDGIKYGLKGNGATYDERIRDSRTQGFGMEVKRRIMLGNYVLSGDNMSTYFRKSLAIKQQLTLKFNELFTKVDAVISPSANSTAFKLDEIIDPAKLYSYALLAAPANMTGLPCVNVPCGKTNSLPAGISITGKKYGEARILQIADYIERSRA